MASKTRLGVAIVSVLMLGGTSLGPAPALAQHARNGAAHGSSMGAARMSSPHASGGRSFASGGRSFGARPFGPGHFPRQFGPHRFAPSPFFRPFVPFGVIGAPIVYAAPYYWGASTYYDSPAYYPPPVAYAAPAVSPASAAPPPPAPPTQNVIEYPNGRYELRGDGMSTPYTWVWIPAPPPPPPAAAPPTSGPGVGQPLSSSPREIYRWTDGDGVLHVTDRLASVPARYRAQAAQAAQP